MDSEAPALEAMAKAIYERFVATQNPMTTYYPPWDEMENPLNRDLWLGMARDGLSAFVEAAISM